MTVQNKRLKEENKELKSKLELKMAASLQKTFKEKQEEVAEEQRE